MTDDEKITIELGGNAYTAWAPTPEQLLVFAADMQDAEKIPAAVMEMLADVFDEADYDAIRARLRARRNDPDRLQMQDVMDAIGQLMESATDFPTEPSSASPAPPTSTGRRSTGRVHSPASTPSGSVRAAS